MKKPLYNHTSEETAYVVDDYPYGFRERTQIRYWLESKASKGVRCMSQTKNPKTGAWNKPKASTYTEIAGCLYLDTTNDHVEWTGVGQYTDVPAVLDYVKTFVKTFPEGDPLDLLGVWTAKKIRLYEALLSGNAGWTVNGVRTIPSEDELGRYRDELAAWRNVAEALNK